MALIKSSNSSRLLKDAIVLDIGDLNRQADRILTVAHAQADQILAAARAEEKRLIDSADARGHTTGIERGLAEGRDAGRREGHAQALEETSAAVENLVERWTAALNLWEKDRAAMNHEARDDVLRFAFALGEKIVRRALQLDPTIVQTQVVDAIKLLSKPTDLTITVNPDDRPLIDEIAPQLKAALAGCEHIAVLDDANLARGGCVIKTRAGKIDSSIDTQLSRIAEALLPERSPLAIESARAEPKDSTE